MTVRFEDIIAWQKAYSFTLATYEVTRNFPENERYGLISQFQRAAVSVPANIAEGYKKISKADKLRFFNIAQGSLEECRCYVHLSKDLRYISDESYNALYSKLEEASKFLNAYCRGVVNNACLDNNQ